MSNEELSYILHRLLWHPFFAGGIGALISVLWHKPTISMVVMHLLAGVFGAMYATQPIVEWQGIGEGMTPFISLIIGMFAGSLLDVVFQFIHSGKLMDLIHDFISHRYVNKHKGGKNDN